MMTAGELKRALSRVRDDAPVFLRADAEGNGMARLDCTFGYGEYIELWPEHENLVG